MDFGAILGAALVVLLPLLGGSGIARLIPQGKGLSSSAIGVGEVFSYGLVVWSICSSLGYLFSLTLYQLLVLFGCLSLSILFYSNSRTSRKWGSSVDSTFGVTFTVASILFVSLIAVGAYDGYSSDSCIHLSYIQRALHLPELSLDVFQLTPEIDSPLLQGAYSYNSVHVLYAACSAISGMDPTAIWVFAAAYILVMFLYTGVSACQRITGCKYVSLVFLVLLLLFWGWIANPTRTFSYPNILGQLLYTTYISLLFFYLRSAFITKAFCVFFCAASGSLLLVHPQWWLYALMTIVALSGYVFLIRTVRYEVAFKLLTIFALGSVTVVLLKWGAYGASQEQLSSFFDQRYAKVTYHVWGMLGFKPLSVLRWYHYIFLAPSLFLVARLFCKRIAGQKLTFHGRDAVAVLLVAFFSIVLFPPFTTLVTELATANFVKRILSYLVSWWGLVLVSILIVDSYNFLLKNRKCKGFRQINSRYQYVVLFTAFIVLAYCLVFTDSSKMNVSSQLERENSLVSIYGPNIRRINASNLKALLDKIPRDAVVLSDMPKLAPMYRGAQSLGPVKNHSVAENDLQTKIDRLFTMETTSNEVNSLLSELNPDYILLSPKNINIAWMRGWKNNNQMDLISEIDDLSLGFLNNRYILFKYNGGHIDSHSKTTLSGGVIECSIEPMSNQNGMIPIPYVFSSDIVPNERGKGGLPLSDGIFDKATGTTSWILPASNWFYINLNFAYEQYDIHKIELTVNNLTKSYNASLRELAFYGRNRNGEWQLLKYIKYDKRKNIGVHTWNVFVNSCDVMDIRIAFRGKGRISLAELTLLGKSMI